MDSRWESTPGAGWIRNGAKTNFHNGKGGWPSPLTEIGSATDFSNEKSIWKRAVDVREEWKRTTMTFFLSAAIRGCFYWSSSIFPSTDLRDIIKPMCLIKRVDNNSRACSSPYYRDYLDGKYLRTKNINYELSKWVFERNRRSQKFESHVARNLYTLIRIVITLLECYYTTSALLHNTDELVVIRHPHLITIRMTYGYSY